MISVWMAYAVGISCLLSVAALAVERACRLHHWPSRWIWMLVLAAPFVLPFAARVFDESPRLADSAARTQPAVSATVHINVREFGVPAPVVQVGQSMSRLAASPGASSLLGTLWICGSALLAIGLAVNWLRMRSKSVLWTRRTLDGTNVLVCADIGPAVIGFWRPEIVVPEWLVSADPQVRRLALTHESEHVRARDPLLLLVGTVAIVLLPWNLPLWWQWRRLRFAIEVDCDSRVLASGHIADVQYAEALLNVAERSAGAPLAAAAMCESASALEKRIHLFLRDRTTQQRAMAVALLVAGIGIAAAASQIDAPVVFDGQAKKPLISGALGGQLIEAIAAGERNSAVALIDAGADVNQIVLGEGTPLIVAARRGDVPLVNLLLDRGAQVDVPVPGDGSPLIAASMVGNLEMATALLDRGADVNGFVLGDETPLINAARAGNLEVVRHLVAKGADVNLAVPAEAGPGAEIRSPLSEARKYDRVPVVDFLQTHGARR